MQKWTKGAGLFLFAEPAVPLCRTEAIGYGRRRFETRRVNDSEFVICKEYFGQTGLQALIEENGLEVVDSADKGRWFSFCAARCSQ